MIEKPIERLNYYNGQRLEADDLRSSRIITCGSNDG